MEGILVFSLRDCMCINVYVYIYTYIHICMYVMKDSYHRSCVKPYICISWIKEPIRMFWSQCREGLVYVTR